MKNWENQTAMGRSFEILRYHKDFFMSHIHMHCVKVDCYHFDYITEYENSVSIVETFLLICYGCHYAIQTLFANTNINDNNY